MKTQTPTGSLLVAGTVTFTRSATRKETAKERRTYANGAGFNADTDITKLAPGSAERKAAFARACFNLRTKD